jgi:hypothetical protein
MSIAQVTHDQAAGGIRQNEWEAFCAELGLAQDTPGGDTWYDARQQIQVIRRGRRQVSFATAQTGGRLPEAARLAVACWARFDGRLTASPEITSIINDAVQAASVSVAAGTEGGLEHMGATPRDGEPGAEKR